MAGLSAARARGRLGGRPRRLTPEQVKMAAHRCRTLTSRSKRFARPSMYRGRRCTATSGRRASHGSQTETIGRAKGPKNG